MSHTPFDQPWGRRRFLHTVATATGASALLGLPGTAQAANHSSIVEGITIQQVMDMIMKDVPGAPFKQTVDTIKAGNPDQPVKGIVTTMFATVELIEKAAAAGANFIIAHEPTFYNHLDDTKWLENDTVFKYKWNLLQKHNMVVWRFHDYIHAHKPDGVIKGVKQAMGWEPYSVTDKPWLLNLPATPLKNIIEQAKKKLGIEHLRFVGDKNQLCKSVVMIPGSAGGRVQISTLGLYKPDLLIVGEVDEWETSEYVRDLRASGGKTALLVLGHIVSEEPGLEWMANWLQPQLPGITVTHIPTNDAFSWA